jgi:hypothetical protein
MRHEPFLNQGIHMWTGIIIFGLVVIFMAGGLLAFRANARLPLPKNLPPPLPDNEENTE